MFRGWAFRTRSPLEYKVRADFQLSIDQYVIEGSLMRLARPRYTIWRLMILVAVVGLLLGGGIGAVRLKRRADYFRGKAADHARLERFFLQLLASEERFLASFRRSSEWAIARLRDLELDSRYFPPAGLVPEMFRSSVRRNQRLIDTTTQFIENLRRYASDQARMKQKYERAASRPWEPLPPEPKKPPEPPAFLDDTLLPPEPATEQPPESRRPEQRPKQPFDGRNLTIVPSAQHGRTHTGAV
jgi:hypothetical protein